MKSRLSAGHATTSCHVPRGSVPRLPTEEGSDTAMCPVALGPNSLPRRAPVPPRALRLRTLPPRWGGFQRYRVSLGPGPSLPEQEGSGATTCSMALNGARAS
jgi:hypothetical protein